MNNHPQSRRGRSCAGPNIVNNGDKIVISNQIPYININGASIREHVTYIDNNYGPAQDRPLQKRGHTYKITRKKTQRHLQYHNPTSTTYFITICTKYHKNILGNDIIIQNHVELSPLGNITDIQWRKIEKDYKNIDLDNYIIMPNHFHAILTIHHHRKEKSDKKTIANISDVVRIFKSQTVIEYLQYINQNNLNISCKIWQRSFYDRIIKNTQTLYTIRKYITNNPKQWYYDKNNISPREK